MEVEEAEEELERAESLEPPMEVMKFKVIPAINCFHCKKDGHGWRDLTL